LGGVAVNPRRRKKVRRGEKSIRRTSFRIKKGKPPTPTPLGEIGEGKVSGGTDTQGG